MRTSPIILGTAGHIDHGKTSLVKALTGIDTDRLQVEKRRGITTELGFAYLDLGDTRIGVIDVPGHERFIRAMAAGAYGIDFVCLVVAADEGIMPQTQEHMDICSLLGVDTGIIAITKVDLVDPEWLALVTEEVSALRNAAFLQNAKVVHVSTQTGEGLPQLRRELEKLTQTTVKRSAHGPFRLPIDRVFSLHGFGTIVTGTVASGTVKLGESIRIGEDQPIAKIRGLEVHGQQAEKAVAGTRCAVNIAGVSVQQLSRGQMLTHPEVLEATHILDVRFRYLKTSKQSLKSRSRVLFHHATSQTQANLILAQSEKLSPGDTAYAQLRLDAATPIYAIPGDRFIVRGFQAQKHYGTTIGGGEILRIHAPKLRGKTTSKRILHLEKIENANPHERVTIAIKQSHTMGISPATLHANLGIAEEKLTSILASLCSDNTIVVAGDGRYIDAEVWREAKQTIQNSVVKRTTDSAPTQDISLEELRVKRPRNYSLETFELLVEELCTEGILFVSGDRIGPATSNANTSYTLSKLEQLVVDKFREWKVTPPKVKELPSIFSQDSTNIQVVLRRLANIKVLTKIKADYYIDTATLDELQSKLEAHLQTQGEITPGEWKTLTEASRKFSIPLAEYFDAKKLTLRIGDIRKLRGL